MSYTNPNIPAAALSLIGLELAIEEIRNRIATISWLDKCFGRAYAFLEAGIDSKPITVPKVYMGGKEYYNCLPNDNLKSQSFFVVEGPETYENYNQFDGSIRKASVSLVVWGDLKKINPSKDYIFTQELISECIKILKIHPMVMEINEIYDEKADKVFSGFDLREVESQYMMYPFAGFRISLTINYDEQC